MEKIVSFADFRVNTPDFEGSRKEARGSERVTLRRTLRVLRELQETLDHCHQAGVLVGQSGEGQRPASALTQHPVYVRDERNRICVTSERILYTVQ